jgi:hypothetical protein
MGVSATNATFNQELQFATICNMPMMNLYFPPSYTLEENPIGSDVIMC